MDLDIKIRVLLDQRFLASVKQLYWRSAEKMTMSGGQWIIGSFRHADFRDTLGWTGLLYGVEMATALGDENYNSYWGYAIKTFGSFQTFKEELSGLQQYDGQINKDRKFKGQEKKGERFFFTWVLLVLIVLFNFVSVLYFVWF